MWAIYELRNVVKRISQLPRHILKKYELWKSIVRYNGPEMLKGFKGFHDESLKGEWRGYRSSRLDILYRVIYRVSRDEMAVYVDDISPHQY